VQLVDVFMCRVEKIRSICERYKKSESNVSKGSSLATPSILNRQDVLWCGQQRTTCWWRKKPLYLWWIYVGFDIPFSIFKNEHACIEYKEDVLGQDLVRNDCASGRTYHCFVWSGGHQLELIVLSLIEIRSFVWYVKLVERFCSGVKDRERSFKENWEGKLNKVKSCFLQRNEIIFLLKKRKNAVLKLFSSIQFPEQVSPEHSLRLRI